MIIISIDINESTDSACAIICIATINRDLVTYRRM